MAIESFFEISGDSVSHGRDNNREHERRFLIKTFHSLPPVQNADLLLDLIYAQRANLKPFSAHPSRKNSYVTQPKLSRQSRWLWELVVPYSTEVDLEDLELKERGNDENPLNKPVAITMDTKLVKVVATEDRHGKPLANTANDPFPDIENEEVWLEFSFEKNIAKAKKEWFLKYPNSINEEEIKILGIPYPKETLWLEHIRLGKKEVGKDGTKYFPINMKLIYREKGWKIRRLNTGTREIKAVPRIVNGSISSYFDFHLIPVRDSQGDPVDEPVFLDSHGRAYRVGVDPEKPYWQQQGDHQKPLRTQLEKSEIITLEFEVKVPRPFKALPLK